MPNAYVLLSIGCNAYIPDGSIYILYVVLDAACDEDAFGARMYACSGMVMDDVDDMFGVRMDVCCGLVLDAVDMFGARMDACGGMVLDAVEDTFGARINACGGVVIDAVDDTFGTRINVCSGLVLGWSCPLRGNCTSNQKLTCFFALFQRCQHLVKICIL